MKHRLHLVRCTRTSEHTVQTPRTVTLTSDNLPAGAKRSAISVHPQEGQPGHMRLICTDQYVHEHIFLLTHDQADIMSTSHEPTWIMSAYR